MPIPVPAPSRHPQRVLVAGVPGAGLSAFLERLATILDLPLVLAEDVAGDRDVALLAAFPGWTVHETPGLRPALLPVTELVLHVQPETTGTLRGLVRRTVRRMRADAPPEPDLGWLDQLALDRPELPLVRLSGPEQVAAWLSDVERSLSA